LFAEALGIGRGCDADLGERTGPNVQTDIDKFRKVALVEGGATPGEHQAALAAATKIARAAFTTFDRRGEKSEERCLRERGLGARSLRVNLR
jgi:hypothetical protein